MSKETFIKAFLERSIRYVYSIFLVHQFCQHAKTSQDTLLLPLDRSHTYHPILSQSPNIHFMSLTNQLLLLWMRHRGWPTTAAPLQSSLKRPGRGERAVEAARLPASGHWPTLCPVTSHPLHHTSIINWVTLVPWKNVTYFIQEKIVWNFKLYREAFEAWKGISGYP